MGDLSPHFSRTEFACRHCLKVKVSTILVRALEVMRSAGYPKGLHVRSGYRCPDHNRAVRGAPGSKHLTGEAADVDPVMTLAEVKALRVFRGIGWKWLERNGDRVQLVTHVDVGARGGATVTNPATWEYLPDGSRR